MLFNSFTYITLFLPVSVAVYFLLNQRQHITAGKIWLFAASLTFYGYWNTQYIALIIISILTNFFIGKSLQRKPDKWLLGTGVAFNLALLCYYKYVNFFIENINMLAGKDFHTLKIILPLGISFFTFQKIAYLVDSNQNKCKEKNFLDFCLFVTFFPQLISGPIVHHQEMMPQFSDKKNKQINWTNLNVGLLIFGIGLFKKTFFADTFSLWADQGFSNKDAMPFIDAWVTSLSYTMQIYFDFSGYTDMAIGSAIMMNIKLPQNFNSPYRATNIKDFWQRWHMTLSRWLRDYLYIPLGGNRNGALRTGINIMATFLLGGLWHGAGWTFIIWGAMHGLAVMAHRLWSSTKIKIPAILGVCITFIFVNVTWVFFRAQDVGQALRILRGMVNIASLPDIQTLVKNTQEMLTTISLIDIVAPGSTQPSIVTSTLYLAAAVPVCMLHNNSNHYLARINPTREESHVLQTNLICVTLFSYAIFLMIYCKFRLSPFIYFNF